MFSNHIAKVFFLLFTVVLVSTTIIVRGIITSVLDRVSDIAASLQPINDCIDRSYYV